MNGKIFSFLFILCAFCAMSGCTSGTEDRTKAKYVFFFIGDGMGPGQVYAAETYLASLEGELGGTGRLTFTRFPYTGMLSTYSANRNITCSSAAGTALATGHKTDNGVLGELPDGTRLRSIAYDLREEGYQIGIMSNGPINHATPASFYANAKSRKDYYDISLQIPGSGFDFFAGDGFLDFNGKAEDQEDIDSVLEAGGYTVSYGLEEYEAEKAAEKLILCQADNRKEDSEDYVVEHTAANDFVLADMVRTAISRFAASDEPFFIMAECGTIDWAGHNNRTMALTEKVMELDAAVAEAYEFYLEHPDETLIIVTADHETGGLALGCGHGSNLDWRNLADSWNAAGKKDVPDDDDNAVLNETSNIGWASGSHSAMPVPVFAVGKGAELFTGWYDNTDIPRKIMREF